MSIPESELTRDPRHSENYVSSEVIRTNLTGKIEVVKSSLKRTRMQQILNLNNTRQTFLFGISGEQKDADIVTTGKFTVGKANIDSVQSIAIAVMEEYGLDLTDSKPKYTDEGWENGKLTNELDETTEEVLIYESNKIQGLAFERTLFTDRESHAFHINWEVVANPQKID